MPEKDSTLFNLIKELIIFYVKENYKVYLNDNNINRIDEDKLNPIVTKLFDEKKHHMKQFVKHSLKDILQQNCPSELIINNILYDIISDRDVCIHTLEKKIVDFQNNKI